VVLSCEGPGSAELFGEVIGRHAVEDVVADQAFIDDDAGESGGHGDGHLNIEGDLDVVGPGLPSVPSTRTLMRGTLVRPAWER